MDYPIWDIGFGGGVLMAVVAILHVIVAHFAIGGGLVVVATEALSVRRGDTALRELARRGSLLLVLISTVFGAITGVGIWVVAGLISPGAISALIHEYVWGWAIEWTFFLVEIIAALVYYTTWGKISKRAHLMVGWIYFVSAYLSLVVINGILTYMLTPGRWLATGGFWDGFFNPTYWPSLVLRTGICALMAAAFLLFVAARFDRDARPRLTRYLAGWLAAGVVVSYAGYRWWEAALPDPARAMFSGDTPLIPALADTRSMTLWALAVALLLGGVLLALVPRAGHTATAVVVALAAFAFFGGYERLREGVRKPFLIHSHLFSNGLRIDAIETINAEGLRAHSGWVAARADAAESGDGSLESYGRAVFEAQCASCHTLDGYQAVRPRLPTVGDWIAVAADDPPGAGERAYAAECASCHPDIAYEEMREMMPGAEDLEADPSFARDMNAGMIAATLETMRDMGDRYVGADRTKIVASHEMPYPHMPPFVGDDADLEALTAYLASLEAGERSEDDEDARVARARGE